MDRPPHLRMSGYPALSLCIDLGSLAVVKPRVTKLMMMALQEEVEKRQGRAARFGEASSSLSYEPVRPVEDLQQLKARAERFNMEFKPPDLTGLATEGTPWFPVRA